MFKLGSEDRQRKSAVCVCGHRLLRTPTSHCLSETLISKQAIDEHANCTLINYSADVKFEPRHST